MCIDLQVLVRCYYWIKTKCCKMFESCIVHQNKKTHRKMCLFVLVSAGSFNARRE